MNRMAKCALALVLLLVMTAVSAMAAEVKVGSDTYPTLEAAVKAKGANQTYEIYGKVTGYFENTGDSTFIGMDDDAEIVVNVTGSFGKVDNVTFKNLTFTTNNNNYKGFHHSTSEAFINCVIKGAYWTYAPTATFEDCTFIQSGSEPYCLWNYGTGNLTIDGCTFISDHKFILLYSEGGSGHMKANIRDSVFGYSDSISSEIEKAAIEMDDRFHNITLNATNNKVDCRNPRGLYYDKVPQDQEKTTVNATKTSDYHHGDLTHKTGVGATHTATGTAEHWICEDCGTLFADKNGTTEVSKEELVIPMLKATPAPTATPVPDTSNMPQTGDNSHLALFALLLTASAAGMVLLMRRKGVQE